MRSTSISTFVTHDDRMTVNTETCLIYVGDCCLFFDKSADGAQQARRLAAVAVELATAMAQKYPDITPTVQELQVALSDGRTVGDSVDEVDSGDSIEEEADDTPDDEEVAKILEAE